MKNLIIISAFLALWGCDASDNEYYMYEPDYDGKYVNSGEKLQAWYRISDEFYHKNDSSFQSVFYGGYYLAKPIIDIKSGDSNGFFILPFPEINVKMKQLRYRDIVDYESKFTSGMKVIIINNTPDTLSVLMQDGSVFMLQEALNPNGEWQPIEYWIHSNCGNSYGNIYFPPKTFIATNAFRYTGSFKTMLRFKLLFISDGHYEKKFIYSNPFPGKVNYSQFQKIKTSFFTDYLE